VKSGAISLMRSDMFCRSLREIFKYLFGVLELGSLDTRCFLFWLPQSLFQLELPRASSAYTFASERLKSQSGMSLSQEHG
jgi:hypothetical protein